MKSQAIVEYSSWLKDLFTILQQIIFLSRLLSILVALDLGHRRPGVHPVPAAAHHIIVGYGRALRRKVFLEGEPL
jgi:hypothetical protein